MEEEPNLRATQFDLDAFEEHFNNVQNSKDVPQGLQRLCGMVGLWILHVATCDAQFILDTPARRISRGALPARSLPKLHLPRHNDPFTCRLGLSGTKTAAAG